MTQAFGRWVIARNRTSAVVDLSDDVRLSSPCASAGACSTMKAAVLMLSDHSRSSGRKGIRVNAVAPGPSRRRHRLSEGPGVKKGRSDVTPLGRVGQVDDVVGGILFLLSDEARYVTATDLIIDGGVTKSIFNHFPARTWD